MRSSIRFDAGRTRLRLALVVSLVFTMSFGSTPAAGQVELIGRVLDLDGDPLEGAVVRSGEIAVSTDAGGRFGLGRLPAGDLTVERPAYSSRTVAWDGAANWLTIRLAPKVVRALHVAGWVAASDGGFQNMLELASQSGVNALVIDLRNENGTIYHQSSVPEAAAIGAQARTSFDLSERTARAHADGLTVITRIVTFQDPIAGRARPSWAVIDTRTGLPMNKGGQVFLDPTDPAPRQYALDLAREACEAGVDEVQFDYVRFPDGGTATARFDGPAHAAARQATITAFLREARSMLLPMGCATAADIFGWITTTPTEGGIGQQFESIADVVDVVSPMIYPSHYSSGWFGFSTPNDHPAQVVTFASQDALDRMGGTTVVLRPWLQDFWYSAAQVRAQIVAVDGLGLGWMTWNILSEFTAGGYPLDGELKAGAVPPSAIAEPPPQSGFWDVSDDSVFAADVEWLAAAAITRGCNAPWNDLFCPDDPVTRGQMAAFLVRALNLPPAEPDFTDVSGSSFAADIGALAAAGVTEGCNPEGTQFCPDDPVTRGQMAALLVRALDLQPAVSSFVDATDSIFASDIGALASAGVTRGCNPPGNTRYCPNDSVTRQQMAAFVHRALNP